MDVVIRELVGLEEIAAIYPLYQQTGSLSEALFRERLAAMISQGNYRCIAAYNGERLVGVAGLWMGTQLWAGKWAEADHVVVDAEMRSAGIGAKLMAWIEREAARVGCDITRISMVLGKERTHQFYSRNGYADDGLIMVKPLSAGQMPSSRNMPPTEGPWSAVSSRAASFVGKVAIRLPTAFYI